MKPTKLAFESRYYDDSGIEFAVRYDAANIEDEIELYHIEGVKFPIARLPWLIAALQRIQADVDAAQETKP